MSSKEIDAASVDEFDPKRALGLWHILGTNLNMWKEKLTPTITYTMEEQLPDGRVRINDLVEYYTRRPFAGFVPTDIKGVDTQSTYKASRFKWRGNGILKLFTSDFGFVFVDNETPAHQPYQWVATMFGSTLFTSAGIDLMTRTRQPPTYVLNQFVRFCQEHPIVKNQGNEHVLYTRKGRWRALLYQRSANGLRAWLTCHFLHFCFSSFKQCIVFRSRKFSFLHCRILKSKATTSRGTDSQCSRERDTADVWLLLRRSITGGRHDLLWWSASILPVSPADWQFVAYRFWT